LRETFSHEYPLLLFLGGVMDHHAFSLQRDEFSDAFFKTRNPVFYPPLSAVGAVIIKVLTVKNSGFSLQRGKYGMSFMGQDRIENGVRQ
jgi:hypothetical protein